MTPMDPLPLTGEIPWLVVVAGLMAGTWVLRGLPFFSSALDNLPEILRQFLAVVPAAALGALVVPDSFLAANPVLTGFILTLAWIMTTLRVPLTITVIALVGATWLILAIL